MPLLARMLLSPLFIDIRAGAVSGLGDLLSDRRISADGHVAVAVGPGQGEQHRRGDPADAVERRHLHRARRQPRGRRRPADRAARQELRRGRRHRRRPHPRRRRSTPRRGSALPMVAVATNLAHDGIASPVSSLLHEGGKGSFGVDLPMAVVVDLDYVRTSPPRMVRSGVGDVVSNLTAIADWRLAARERGEPVDGLAVTFARTAAEAVLHRTDGIESTTSSPRWPRRSCSPAWRWRPPAPAGRAAAPTTRSCTRSTSSSRAPPTTASWPASAPCSRRSCAANEQLAAQIDACLRRHDLPARPGRPRAHGRAVRRGRRARPEHAARPLHDPRAPRPRPGGGARQGRRLRRGLRRVTGGGESYTCPVVAFRSRERPDR